MPWRERARMLCGGTKVKDRTLKFEGCGARGAIECGDKGTKALSKCGDKERTMARWR